MGKRACGCQGLMSMSDAFTTVSVVADLPYLFYNFACFVFALYSFSLFLVLVHCLLFCFYLIWFFLSWNIILVVFFICEIFLSFFLPLLYNSYVCFLSVLIAED